MSDLVERLGRGFQDRLVRRRRLHLLLEGGDVAENVAELVFGKAGLAHFLAEARQGHNGFLAVVVFHEQGLRTQPVMRTVYTGFRGSKSVIPSHPSPRTSGPRVRALRGPRTGSAARSGVDGWAWRQADDWIPGQGRRRRPTFVGGDDDVGHTSHIVT